MPISLIHRLCEVPLAVVDLETTGASAALGHRAIEIGIVRIEGGKKVAEYQQLLDPQRRISAGVTVLTGISQQMVEGQPTFADAFSQIHELLSGAAILGHNIRFDLSFLCREYRWTGREIEQALGPTQVLDTVRIARRRFGRGGNALQLLARRLGLTPPVAHRALADAQTTAWVFERLMEPLGGWDLCLCDAVQQQGGPMGLLPTRPSESLLPLELEEAMESRKPVVMEYMDGDEQRTERVIQPLHVRRRSGELTLVAFCQLRNARRTFKLDRIVRLRRVEEPPLAVPAPAPVSMPTENAAEVM